MKNKNRVRVTKIGPCVQDPSSPYFGNAWWVWYNQKTRRGGRLWSEKVNSYLALGCYDEMVAYNKFMQAHNK